MNPQPKPRRVQDGVLKAKMRRLPCVACGKGPPSDAAHIKTVGSGGHDVEFNLLSLCRSCHLSQHSKGWKWMIERYPSLRSALRELGWCVDESNLSTLFRMERT